MPYEILDHTADLAFRVRSKSLEGLFEEAGRALFTEMLGDLSEVKPETKEEIEITAQSVEDLLIEWLSELLFRFDAQGKVYSKFEVKIKDKTLLACIYGENLDQRRHKVKVGMKGVTYHMLSVKKSPQGYEATFLVDI